MNTIILIIGTALLYGASSFAVAYLCLQEWVCNAPTPRQIISTALAIIFSPLIILIVLLYGAVMIIWGVCELLIEEWKNNNNKE
jgi:hypothetical protein